MTTLSLIILANVLVSLISLIGFIALSIRFLKKPSSATYLVSFAAGVLLSTAILDILPEALEGIPTFVGLNWFLYGIIGAFLLERSFTWYHHHHEDTHGMHPTAGLILFGDGIHNFIDGLAIAAAFLASPVLGWTATIAIAAHEIPQEIADYSILIHQGMSKNKALFWNFMSALTAIIGGIVGFYVFHDSFKLVYYALALTSGIFLYVATADLIPELHSSGTSKNWLPQTLVFISGILLIMILTSIETH